MKLLFPAVVASLCLALSGCGKEILDNGIYGKVVEGSTQPIKIVTTPVTSATCVLTNAQVKVTITSPSIAYVQRTQEALHVHCLKPGWNGDLVIQADDAGWGYGDPVPDFSTDANGVITTQTNTFYVPMTQDGNKSPPAPNKSPSGSSS